jgi:hypothetical protein
VKNLKTVPSSYCVLGHTGQTETGAVGSDNPVVPVKNYGRLTDGVKDGVPMNDVIRILE